MANITYLLGAGASANALPLIKKSLVGGRYGLSDELKSFVEVYRSSAPDNKVITGKLQSIVTGCLQFGTADLYAKFLLETGDTDNYQILKKLLSNYFEYKQTQYKTPGSNIGCSFVNDGKELCLQS